MKTDYQYPLDTDWTTDEMVKVVDLWSALEQAYEKGISPKEFLTRYQAFKTVVTTISEEKRMGNQFEKLTGYSLYRTVKQATEQEKGKLLMKAGK